MKWLLGLSLCLVAATSHAEQTYGKDLRVAQIRNAITALAEAPASAVQQGTEYARALERGACSAGTQRVRVECLLVAVRKYCAERPDARSCLFYMDVVASNVLADERLIPPERRYQIVRENVDYRPALAKELNRIQGALAVDFRLHGGDAKDPATLAASIDKYCLATADETKLSYQICVSSLIWFLQGAK
jgi:hypothetical protein